MAALFDVGSARLRAPTGLFSPDWLYYRKRLWYRPTIALSAGVVSAFHETTLPEAKVVEGLLSPCWVNAHVHLELTHLRSKFPQGRGMIDFLTKMGPERGTAPPSAIQAALESALAEGTCAFVSHQNVPLPPQAIPEGVVVQSLGEFFGLRMQRVHARLRKVKKWGYPLTPHSFYSLSRPLWRAARRVSSFPRSIHFFESIEEKLWLEKGEGPFRQFFRQFIRHPRPPQWRKYLRQLYRRAPAVWLVHATEVPQQLMEELMQRFPRLYAVLCPEANYYLFRRFPDWRFWRRYADRLLIGTDSLANSPSLSVWQSVRRFWMSGFSWEEILQAVVETPQQWISTPPLWVRIYPVGRTAQILPESKAELFTG